MRLFRNFLLLVISVSLSVVAQANQEIDDDAIATQKSIPYTQRVDDIEKAEKEGLPIPPPAPTLTYRVDTPRKKNALVGRYLYVGELPRFDAKELELFVSKMSLTLRVKAKVSSQKIYSYAGMLLNRWDKMRRAFESDSLYMLPIKNPDVEIKRIKSPSGKAALIAANQYMAQFLDGQGVDIFKNFPTKDTRKIKELAKQSQKEYEEKILTAVLRAYMLDKSLTISEGIKLLKNYNKAPNSEENVQLSKDLFFRQFSKPEHNSFTSTPNDPDYEGYLTIVYPIASTTKGPFADPKENYYELGRVGSVMEARWWSNKWDDAFGGFPFLNFTWSGIAFHGPVTLYKDSDLWYLKRGHVSHSCHRMDGGDVMELYRMLPPGIFDSTARVPLHVYSWPDVTDVDEDGKLESIDVAYYWLDSHIRVKSGQDPVEAADSYAVDKRQIRFWNHHYGKSKIASRYMGGEKFHKEYDFDLENKTLSGVPTYELEKCSRSENPTGKCIKKSDHKNNVKIKTYPFRAGRIIQYIEEDVKLTGFDDTRGEFPPEYFQMDELQLDVLKDINTNPRK